MAHCKDCEFYNQVYNTDGELIPCECERDDYDSDEGWFEVTPYKKACENFEKKEK